ncbi:hypothetical protein [Rhodoferax sp. GW822-FHT02A01]|uniref:hypothetical protein n=1 Tax=Rhodoferax sp. GW822-FHT02A01 TaxID=3141537 RepID=UPI00315D5773
MKGQHAALCVLNCNGTVGWKLKPRQNIPHGTQANIGGQHATSSSKGRCNRDTQLIVGSKYIGLRYEQTSFLGGASIPWTLRGYQLRRLGAITQQGSVLVEELVVVIATPFAIMGDTTHRKKSSGRGLKRCLDSFVLFDINNL